MPRLTMAVNLWATPLRHGSFVEQTLASIAAAGLNPGDVFLEVTENRSVPDEDLDAVRRLRAEGVRFALDDFGIFHSNLGYLQRFPVDVLKIDRSFVAGVTDDEIDRGIVHAILALSNSLKLEVIAEGVESRGQWGELLAAGCRLAQGYFFSPPLPAEQARELIEHGVRIPPIEPVPSAAATGRGHLVRPASVSPAVTPAALRLTASAGPLGAVRPLP